jgi:hypothetical protein
MIKSDLNRRELLKITAGAYAQRRYRAYPYRFCITAAHPGSMPSLSLTATLKRCLQPI